MEGSGPRGRREDDDALMATLAAVLARVDPCPPTHRAEALLTWRRVDAELAQLLGAGAALGPRFSG